jgi:hypothetical protein
VISTPQASGQSCGQAACTTFFIVAMIITLKKTGGRGRPLELVPKPANRLGGVFFPI